MGNPWRPTEGKSDWFPMPRLLINGGHLRDLNGGALKLYLFLSFLAQKHTAINLEIGNREIEIFCGLHHDTAKQAREELVQAKLITSKDSIGGPVTYTLVEPGYVDSAGNPVPLTPKDFPEGGGLRKFKPSIPRGKSANPLSENPLPGSRKIRYPLSENPLPPLLQVAEKTDQKQVATSLKNSEKKGFSEDFRSSAPGGLEGAAFERLSSSIDVEEKSRQLVPPSWDSIGKPQQESKETKPMVATNRSEEITASLERDPVVARLAEKLNAKIVDVVDHKSETKSGNVGSPGLPFEQWDAAQRRLKNGGRILARDEALQRHGHITPPVKAQFVTPEPYTPRSQLGQPARCAIHGVTDWWRRADGELICERCHPDPHSKGEKR